MTDFPSRAAVNARVDARLAEEGIAAHPAIKLRRFVDVWMSTPGPEMISWTQSDQGEGLFLNASDLLAVLRERDRNWAQIEQLKARNERLNGRLGTTLAQLAAADRVLEPVRDERDAAWLERDALRAELDALKGADS